MAENKLTIWCNDDLKPEQQDELRLLIDGVGNHQLLRFKRDENGQTGTPGSALKESDVVFGYPDPHAVLDSHRVRWVHLNSAGYTSFDYPEIRNAFITRGTILTNSSAVYDEPCAQHLLAMMLSLARNLPAALDVQRGERSWSMSSLRSSSRLLNGQTVLMLGFGSIAQRLAELLQPLNMNLIAVRRNIAGNEPIAIIDTAKVDEYLPLADHVVNILPANEQTRNFLNVSRLRRLKPGAIVYNIGRGTTLDQPALIEGLRRGQIAAAYLDVTDPEPLPPDHPLWQAPNCFITPHAGGGHTNEKERQVRHFLENLSRFEQGKPLLNRIW